jgi:hypothetical protein
VAFRVAGTGSAREVAASGEVVTPRGSRTNRRQARVSRTSR